MISVDQAQRIVLDHAPRLNPEEVELLQALGRVICEDIRAPWDIPGADNSAMDGYAFSAALLKGDTLTVKGFLPAGKTINSHILPGEAVKIMTGAPVPQGCDTVIPVEDVEAIEDRIRLCGHVKPGTHIRRQGEELRKGELAVAAGSILRPQEIGLLTSLGRKRVFVHGRPRVGILATGDELVEPGSPLEPGKLYNSNSFGIAAQVIESGAEPVILGIAADSSAETRRKLEEGAEYDLLITTGGVSVGDRDCVKETITALGGEILFWKVDMKPGKPVAFAILNGKPVFALPGNPVAAMVGFEMFVRPSLLQQQGRIRIFRPVVRALLTEDVRNKGERPHFVRVLVERNERGYVVTTTGNQSSARISSLTAGNALLRLAAGASMAAGEEVSVSLLDREFESGSTLDVTA
jgi:molybdopterin molybdotransferase